MKIHPLSMFFLLYFYSAYVLLFFVWFWTYRNVINTHTHTRVRCYLLHLWYTVFVVVLCWIVGGVCIITALERYTEKEESVKDIYTQSR